MKSKYLPFVALLFFLLLSRVGGAADNSAAPVITTNTQNTAGDATYLEAERAFVKNDFQESLEKLSRYFSIKDQGIKLPPKTLARAYNLKGLIYFQLKNLTAATQEFEHAVAIAADNFPPEDSALHLARYNLANALHQSGHTEEAFALLQQVFPSALDSDTRTRFYHLQGNISNSLNLALPAVLAYLRAAQGAKDPVIANAHIQRAFSASKQMFLQNPQDDVSELEHFATEINDDSAGALGLKLILARGQMYLGNHTEALHLIEDFLGQASLEHPLHNQAEEIKQQIERLSIVDPQTIGILVPLSGKFSKYGRLCLNAALMALGAFEEMTTDSNATKYRFVVKDSGDSAESALAAFDRLVFEDHTIAVVGPLLSKQGAPVAQKAQEYGVPLFSLSQRNESGRLGSYIFPIALSPQQQIEIIADHSINERGYKRFAIMAPSDSFGDEYVKLFWDAIEAHGGSIVALERYAPKSTDFHDELKDMLGLQYPEARRLELDELKRRSEIFASKLKARGLTRKRVLQAFDPKPIVDFDAVFIPDDPQIIGQIAPAFAAHDVDNLAFLGINTWNNPEIIQRAGRYVQNALFVDAFFAQSQDPKVQSFIAEFRRFFSTAPGSLEVQSYDASKLLLHVIGNTEPQTRAQLLQNLLATNKYEGSSGEFKFSTSGMTRSAYLLTVKANSIIEVPQH